MLVVTAEESYRKGLEALGQGRRLEALALFEAAIELDRQKGLGRPQGRYLSYYGLCLSPVAGRGHEALDFCRQASQLEQFDPDVCCNLGRVLMRLGRRREAFDAFLRGLKVEPRHARIRRALRVMGVRRRPVLSFLPRQHPLNVLLGRLRPRLRAA